MFELMSQSESDFESSLSDSEVYADLESDNENICNNNEEIEGLSHIDDETSDCLDEETATKRQKVGLSEKRTFRS